MSADLSNCWTIVMEESVRLAIEYLPHQVPYALLASCLNARALAELHGAMGEVTEVRYDVTPVSTNVASHTIWPFSDDVSEDEKAQARQIKKVQVLGTGDTGFGHALRFVKDEAHPIYALCIINIKNEKRVKSVLWWLQRTQPRALQLQHVEQLQADELRQRIDILFKDEVTPPSGASLYANLQELSIGAGDEYRCTDILKALAKCTLLRKLDLSTCKNLFSLNGLQAFALLEELDLSYTNIKDLTGLRSCANLALLHIIRFRFCQKMVTLAGIESLPRLEHLDATCSSMQEFTGLKECSCIRSLTLQQCEQLGDCKGMKGSCVQTLNLSRSSVNQISFVTDMPYLSELNLCETAVDDLSPLRGCSASLQVVNLSQCYKLRDFSPLGDLRRLEQLVLNKTGVDDLTSLSRCLSLKVLDLSVSSVEHLEGTEGMRMLTVLDLTYTDVISLVPLQPCLQMERLILNRCWYVESLEGLEGMTSLTELDLTATKVASLEPIHRCTRMKKLWLELWNCAT